MKNKWIFSIFRVYNRDHKNRPPWFLNRPPGSFSAFILFTFKHLRFCFYVFNVFHYQLSIIHCQLHLQRCRPYGAWKWGNFSCYKDTASTRLKSFIFSKIPNLDISTLFIINYPLYLEPQEPSPWFTRCF